MGSYGEYTDEKLLELMNVDDEKAFRVIYERYWSFIYSVGFKVAGTKEAAEDSVQHVFMSLWDRRSMVEIAGNLKSYLATAVKYNALSLKLQYKNRARLLTEVVPNNTAKPLAPDQALEEKILAAFLSTVIENLPAKTREIYNYSRVENLSNKEIAATMYISEKTVEAHITKALKAIRLSLTQIRLWTMLF